MSRRSFDLALPLALLAGLSASAAAQDPESRVRNLEKEVGELKSKLDTVLEEMAEKQDSPEMMAEEDAWFRRFTLAGYGESHANFTQHSDDDFLDNHRIVLYLGYQFADWIQFHSETEIEHSFVSDDNGELSFEQLYTDLMIDESFNVRIGRFLVPVGIINKTHEPTTFYSVERPSVDKSLIPTTWSSDGVGIYGRFGSAVGYELYIGSGLDGSKFDAINGIRGGRLKERPGINEPGVTGRIDYYPMPDDPDHDLRIGGSFFASGLDTANKGTSGAPGDLLLVSADLQYRHRDLEVRAVYVFEHVSDADDLNAMFGNNVAADMQGYYVEAAYHWLPESWKTGKLEDASSVVFVRFEDYDTQYHMPSGTTANPDGERQEVTSGLAFFLTSQFVLKADFQWRDEQPDLWNLGLGFRF